MKKVKISHIPCFVTEQVISRVNDFVEVNKSLMPHSVAAATGCTLQESMGFLLYLFGVDLVDAFILIYHSNHPDHPVSGSSLIEFDSLEKFYCSDCDIWVEKEEIMYDFEFRLNDEIEFTL